MKRSLPEASGFDTALHLWRTVVGAVSTSCRSVEHRFSVGVSGAVLDPDGRLLLLRHAFRRHHPWGLVSGWVNAGEAPADAMMRELHEETSLSGTIGQILCIRGDRRAPSLEVVYMVRVSGGTFRPSAETPEGRWFDLRDALPEGLHPRHRPLIALATHVAQVS
jgi:ADP-ribose pyrophosphatase YjhB (NUDIX family)